VRALVDVAQEQPLNGRDILILAPHTLDCLVLIEISTMDEAVARRDGKGFACCCMMVLPVMAIVLFSLGAVQFTHHQQYRNVATGNLIGMHIDPGRDALGSRYFHLVEEYHIAEKELTAQYLTTTTGGLMRKATWHDMSQATRNSACTSMAQTV
jgi:hypothetical protein